MGLAMRTTVLLGAIVLVGGAGNLALFLWGPSGYGEFRAIGVEGDSREYLLHLPPGLGSQGPAALVVALHPLGGWSHQFARVSQWTTLADQEGFAVVFPDGQGPLRHVGQGWNAVHCCGYGFERNVDDVAFLDALLDELLASFPFDPAQVYVVGHSNGAMMAYTYAALRPERLAAIGAVAGAIASGPSLDQMVSTPAASGPVSVAIVHGTRDGVVPFDGGGNGDRGGWRFAPVDDAVSFWLAANGAERPGDVRALGGGTTQTTFAGSGGTVQLTAVAGGRHGWPGGLGNPLRDPPGGQVDATALIWSFFEGHRAHPGETQAPSGSDA